LTEKLKIFWVYALTALFLVVNFYLVLHKDFYWFFLLPVALLVLYYYLYSLDKIILLITFLTPFAINISDMELGLGVSLPSEPLMFGVLLIFIANLIFENKYDRRLNHHPVSYIIYLSLLWMLFTAFTSEMPVVSLKYFLARLWFVVPFYFIAAVMFRKISNIKKFFWLYTISLIVVIGYTIIKHASYGFDEETGHWVMSPFYNDHTAYGAAISMFIPVIVGFLFYPGINRRNRFFIFIVLSIMIMGLILSYARAAWISVVVAFAVFIIVVLRIRFYWILLFFILFFGVVYTFQNQLIDMLEKNKQDSSANLIEHVESITNISSDASNLERINRWQAALRLYDERPIVGWGPGTYQFVYAPFQRSREKTIISTNLGDMGNAHSEYLGPLSEMGMLGMLIVLLLMVYVIYTGTKVYKFGKSETKYLSLMATLGLVTYYTHGMLNNFLDTDKLSVPFWGFIAVIVALDLYHTNYPEKNKTIPE